MKLNFAKGGGLLPAVVQDVEDGAVLMVGYMNEEALGVTKATGRVTFFSRSKDRLWTKGETSGNWLSVEEVAIDCDGDALLILASAHGPTCHTGSRTCFGDGYSFKQAPASKRLAQKVGEEAVEVVIEATAGNRVGLVSESADLLYHLLVLLESEELTLSDVVEVLRNRHPKSV
jgi:phosphoribosyl-ATP pyrophosphohydrolase/phosphoribosyl-AMP cyclohydrolase